MKKERNAGVPGGMRLLPLLLQAIILLTMQSGLISAAAAAPVKDLASHPLYSTYKFEKDGRHIYFGNQPIRAPEGVICEVMKRDPILRKRLQKLGKEIVFYPFFKGSDSNFFMLRDQIDIAISGDMPVLTITTTDKTVITAIAKLGSTSIVTRKLYSDIRDLKGKRVGFPQGTTAQLAILSALAAAGMKESDIRSIPMEVSELITALENKRIDAFSAWEPVSSEALSRQKDFTAIHRLLNSSYLYQTRQFAQKHPEASLQIHASFVRALHWMNASNKNLELAAKWSLQAAEKLTGHKSSLTVEQLVRVTAEGIALIARMPIIPQSDFKQDGFLGRSFDFLKKQGKIPPEVSWDKIRLAMDNKSIKTVLADPEKYQLDNFFPEQD